MLFITTYHAGGIITAADLASYKVQIKDPLRVQINDYDNNQFEVLSAPPPSSGVVGQMIVNIMDGKVIVNFILISGAKLDNREVAKLKKYGKVLAQVGFYEYEVVAN